MLLDSKEALVVQTTGAFKHFDRAAFHAPFILLLLLLLIIALSVWRPWTFTLFPWLNPNEPKEMPNWISCEF